MVWCNTEIVVSIYIVCVLLLSLLARTLWKRGFYSQWVLTWLNKGLEWNGWYDITKIFISNASYHCVTALFVMALQSGVKPQHPVDGCYNLLLQYRFICTEMKAANHLNSHKLSLGKVILTYDGELMGVLQRLACVRGERGELAN